MNEWMNGIAEPAECVRCMVHFTDIAEQCHSEKCM